MHQYRDKYDIVVVGGGTGGAPAAIAAGRNGASVLLIEKNGFLGGLTTGGLVTPWPHWLARHSWQDFKEPYVEGIHTEILGRLQRLGGLAEDGRTWNEEVLKYVLEQMCLEAGVHLLFHSFVFRLSKDVRQIKSLDIANKSGLRSVSGNIFVDGTGDADLMALAGIECKKGRETDGATQPMTTVFRLGGVDTKKFPGFSPFQYLRGSRWVEQREMPDEIANIHREYLEARKRGEITNPRVELHWMPHSQPGVLHFNATRVQGLDATRAEDLTDAEIQGKRQVIEIVNFLRRFPSFADAYISQMGSDVGIRETRRIIGHYVLTDEDVLSGRKFPDGIARGHGPIDIHDPTEPSSSIQLAFCPDYTSYDIPYRCLVPKEIENILIGSRCVSATHEAFASVRLIPQVSAIGQAAGTAAALAHQGSVSVQQLDVDLLRAALKEQGASIWEEGMPG